MTDRMPISITNGRDTVVFGRDGFVLHDLDRGAPKIAGERTAGRTVIFSGYILPIGETAAARSEKMETLIRRLCRIVTSRDGFTLSVGEKHIRLLAACAPVFAHEAPLNGDEAAFFTVTASAAVPSAAYFQGGDMTVTGRGWTGQLVFPLAITEETLFARGTSAGEFAVFNPGDVPAGFVLSVTAEWHPITAFTVTSDSGETVSVTRPVSVGESVVIDTRPGEKTVTAEGESALADLSFDSAFFSLRPGENRLFWNTAGGGTAAMRIVFAPLYH